MPEIRSRILVGGTAPATVLRVEGVLELGQRVRAVLDAEKDDVGTSLAAAVHAEVRHERVIGVQNIGGFVRALADQSRPIVGEPLELPVAVELVTKEVAEHDGVWLELAYERL